MGVRMQGVTVRQERDKLKGKHGASLQEVQYLERKLAGAQRSSDAKELDNNKLKKELREMAAQLEGLAAAGEAEQKDSMSQVVGQLARDKALLEQSLAECRRQLVQAYDDCEQLNEQVWWAAQRAGWADGGAG